MVDTNTRDASPRVLGGRYEVGELIGRGGMAEVHIGHDARLGRTVAIKILRSDLARDPAFLARFQREAQSAASLNYPAIVAVYDSGEDTYVDPTTGENVHIPYIVMEYVEGHTVRDILNHGDAVPIDEAVEITSGVLSALDYSHHAGIIHRDIKPGNVMITPTGAVKVMDFGIARAVADSAATMTQTQAVIGTAQYLSPEQARGETVDARSDIYSTGCLLFELLTGRPPFVGDSPVAVAYQHVGQAPMAPSDFAADVPPDLDRITLKALAKERSQRYSSAADFRADLDAFLAGQALAPNTHPVIPTVQPTQVYQPQATQVYPGVSPATPGYGATQVFRPGVGETQHLAATHPNTAPGATAVYRGGLTPPATVPPATVPPTVEAVVPSVQPPRPEWGPLPQVVDDHVAAPLPEEPHRSKVWLWILIPALILAAGIAAFFLLRGGPEEELLPTTAVVPTFAQGVTPDQACAQLDDLELVCDRRFDENSNAPEGTFLRQEPAGGTELELHQPVIVWFSGGPSLVSVPNLEGMTTDQARDRLAQEGLLMGTPTQEPSANIPAGLVTRTQPGANIAVNRGDTIGVYISNGLVDLPDLRGQTENSAVATLNSLGLSHRTVPQPSSTQPAGTVISHSPAAGQIDQGSEVTLTVATAPEVELITVPSVVGQNWIEVSGQFQGLAVNVVEAYSSTMPAGAVISTSPGGGTQVESGSTVTVQVSRGPELTDEQRCTNGGGVWVAGECRTPEQNNCLNNGGTWENNQCTMPAPPPTENPEGRSNGADRSGLTRNLPGSDDASGMGVRVPRGLAWGWWRQNR